MRPLFQLVVACLVLQVSLASGQGRQVGRFAVLEPGVFHGQDVPLDQPASWAALVCRAGSCRIRPATIRMKRVPDPLGEDDPQRPTGTSIEVSSDPQPLFLVRGLNPSARSIATAFVGENNLVAGNEQGFSLSGHRYVLRVEGHTTGDNELPKGSRLVLADGSISQELFSLPEGGNDPHITVLWVGDIDGDGRPDLYLDASWHYNISHKVLWLSSIAGAGQLVGQAAIFETTGC
jgi:hypothetical protein